MNPAEAPSPALFFDTINAYQKSAALKAAIDLNLFTAIGAGSASVAEIASRCSGTERGVRILCDYLTILGFLGKQGDRYVITPSTATFLDRNSPAYTGSAADFLLAPELTRNFECLADAVRKGGTAHSELGTVAPEHPVWVAFARGMGPLMMAPAEALAELLSLDPGHPAKILDVSASHGVYGLAFARRNPTAHLVALDWAPVLEVAKENARATGVAERFSTIEGSAFDVELGSGYDLVLIPNFLHHFSAIDCTRFLRKVHAALHPGGRVAIVEFVPNPDRVTPPDVAGFSLVMLASTPSGDAYTFAEYEAMLREASFDAAEKHPLPPSTATVVIAAWQPF